MYSGRYGFVTIHDLHRCFDLRNYSQRLGEVKYYYCTRSGHWSVLTATGSHGHGRTVAMAVTGVTAPAMPGSGYNP